MVHPEAQLQARPNSRISRPRRTDEPDPAPPAEPRRPTRDPQRAHGTDADLYVSLLLRGDLVRRDVHLRDVCRNLNRGPIGAPHADSELLAALRARSVEAFVRLLVAAWTRERFGRKLEMVHATRLAGRPGQRWDAAYLHDCLST